MKILTGVLVHRVTRPLRGSVSCGSGQLGMRSRVSFLADLLAKKPIVLTLKRRDAHAARRPLMPPPARKRARASADAPSAASIELVGGLAEKPSTIAKFRDGRLTDVEVVAADGTAFHAHALCITSGSEYFERLLAGERWADTAGRPLSLPEVPKQGLAACLEFIYTGSCALADEAELIVVLEAAAYLQIPPLVDAAAKAMSTHLSAATALAFWAVADRQGLSQLAADAVSAAARHFEQIAATPAWLSAPAETVRVLLASDRLKVADEEAVYSAAVKWLHAQAPPPAEDDARWHCFGWCAFRC